MLEVRHLTKRYGGIPAIDDISFVIRPGEVLGYLGPNGAGKSTTVKILIGLIEPTAGQILLNGEDVAADRPGFLRRVGYVPEEPNLYRQLTGIECLQLAGRLRGMPRAVLSRRSDEMLRLFGLWEDRHSRVASYSKGMRQKILLCAALLHNPEVLILDEPFSGLDVNSSAVLRSLVRSLAADGRMIFYSSHVLEVVETVCSSVLILRKGTVVAHDRVARLRHLMQQTSLEGVFAQLTEQQDPACVVDGILAAMRRTMATTPRDWLEATHSARFELQRHFFSRFFDLDFVSKPADWRPMIGGTVALLAPLSQFYGRMIFHKYLYLNGLDDPRPYERAARADILFLVTLAMLIVAILTTLEWSSLFPSLRDYLALASLPVRMSDVFLAHFGAVFWLALIFTNVMVSSPSFVLPMAMHGRLGAQSYQHILGIYCAGSLAGWFTFFLLVTAQGVLLNVVPVRHFPRVSLLVQSITLIVLLCAVPWVLSIPNLQAYMDTRPMWIFFTPPLWFLGLEEVVAGTAEPAARELGRLALGGALGALFSAIGVYWWSYHRHRVRVLESSTPKRENTRAAWDNILHKLIRRPEELAILDFATKTLVRSQQHRLMLAVFGALAFALCSESLASTLASSGYRGFSPATVAGRQAIISIPLAFSLFVLSGFRYVFRLPFELRANWILRLCGVGKEPSFFLAIEKVLYYFAILPLSVLAIGMETIFLGPWPGLFTASVSILGSMGIVEALLMSLETVPFASSYLPGERSPLVTVMRYAAGVAVYVWGFSAAIEWCLKSTAAEAMMIAATILIWNRIRNFRKNSQPMRRIRFEELGDPAVRTLGLEAD